MSFINVVESTKRFLLVAVIVLAVSSFSSAANYLFSISNDECVINVLDPSDASIEAVKIMQLPGTSFDCGQFGNGLAADSSTGDLWAIVQVVGQTSRRLVRIDPDTGAMTSIGNTDRFAAIAFNGDGSVLYGVTGKAATTPETLHTLNKTNATATQVCTLTNGDHGKALAFNTTDSLLYHASTEDSVQVFEKVTTLGPGACGVTSIGTSGSNGFYEPTALGFAGSGQFYLSSYQDLYSVTDAGVVSSIGTFDDFDISKGLAITGATLNYANLGLSVGCSRKGKSDMTERITVANLGSTSANNAVVTIRAFSSTTLISDTASGGCSDAGGVITCDVGDLSAGETISFDIFYTVGHKRNANVFHLFRTSSDEWETFADASNNYYVVSNKCTGRF